MNYWGEGNHQQPKPTGREMPSWLPGALLYGGAAIVLLLVAVIRWIL